MISIPDDLPKDSLFTHHEIKIPQECELPTLIRFPSLGLMFEVSRYYIKIIPDYRRKGE